MPGPLATRSTLRTICSVCQITCKRLRSDACPFYQHTPAVAHEGHSLGQSASTLPVVDIRSQGGTFEQSTGAFPVGDTTSQGRTWTSVNTRRGPVPGPRSFPLIGSLYKYIPYLGEYNIKDQRGTDRRRYKKYGRLVREQIFPGFVIYHVYDPELIRQIYHQEREYPERFPMPGLKAYREDRKEGNGIALSNGDEWKRLRKASAELMKRNYLQQFFDVQVGISEELIDLIATSRDHNHELVDSLPIFYRYALESVCKVLFGKRFGILEPNLDKSSDAMRLIEAVLTAMDSLYHTTFFWPLHRSRRTKAWRNLCQSSDFIRSIGMKHAEQCKNELENQPDGGTTSYLKTLISRPELSSQDYLSIVADVIFAGIETTGHVVAFNMYNLARNPDKQALLYKEIQEKAPVGKELNSNTLQSMTYMKAVMKETFRYTPLGVGNARITTKEETVLDGYSIPKGSLMMLNSLIPSESPEYVSEPAKFIPERWLCQGEKKLHPYLVLPFGLGGRSCIGRRLAMQEMQVALVKLLQNYKVEYHHEDVGWVTRFGNIPDRPLNLRFINR